MKKITYFFVIALMSLYCNTAWAGSIITVNPGDDVAAALTACASGDIIELSAVGTYKWNAMIAPKLKSFTIRAKAGLASRPIIEAGSAINFGFIFTRLQAPATGTATQTYDGITFDGMMLATTFFIVKDDLGANTDIVINNCKFRGIANATTPLNITALTYSSANNPPNPNPDNLTITNSVFLFDGYGVVVGAGIGRPKNITITNCFFKGKFVKTLANSSAYTVDLWKLDHNTFEGNNSMDVSLWGNADIKNCIFSNSTATGSGSTANAFGTGGNLMTKCGVFYNGTANTMFATNMMDATTLRTDPKLDANGFATAAEYVDAGSDGNSIGFYEPLVGLTVEAINVKTGLFTPRSVATLAVSQQGNVFTVKGIDNSNYAVYSVAGNELVNGQITNNKMQLSLNKGIYLLKANGQVAKFAVR
jgi:hypothetical protein